MVAIETRYVTQIRSHDRREDLLPLYRWFVGLSDYERQELGRLDFDTCIDHPGAGICRDWIEEHGGDKDWWEYLKTVEVHDA